MLIRSISALYVDPRGSYPKVVADWWDEKRNAMLYAGPNPVIAHPPCQRWCRLAGLVEARWGYKRGEDGGTFAAALASVRTWGGVLEHPAYSDAWAAYGMARPETGGTWTEPDEHGGRSCYVEQWRYGHRAKKATWLYYVGARAPFDLRFGHIADTAAAAAGCAPWRDHAKAYARPTHRVSHMKPGKYGTNGGNLTPLSKSEAIRTPPEFLQTLIFLAAFSRWGV